MPVPVEHSAIDTHAECVCNKHIPREGEKRPIRQGEEFPGNVETPRITCLVHRNSVLMPVPLAKATMILQPEADQ